MTKNIIKEKLLKVKLYRQKVYRELLEAGFPLSYIAKEEGTTPANVSYIINHDYSLYLEKGGEHGDKTTNLQG